MLKTSEKGDHFREKKRHLLYNDACGQMSVQLHWLSYPSSTWVTHCFSLVTQGFLT